MPGKILIIDDEKLMVKATSLLLELADYEVISASNGETGIQSAKDNSPDLVLLDIMMYGMDGWEVLKAFKEDPSLAKIPVIIFTAKEYLYGYEKSIAAGAVGFISKPYDPEEMVQLISEEIISLPSD
ncbi:response regulator [bacterium]|nr:response regulator [bacterium]